MKSSVLATIERTRRRRNAFNAEEKQIELLSKMHDEAIEAKNVGHLKNVDVHEGSYAAMIENSKNEAIQSIRNNTQKMQTRQQKPPSQPEPNSHKTTQMPLRNTAVMCTKTKTRSQSSAIDSSVINQPIASQPNSSAIKNIPKSTKKIHIRNAEEKCTKMKTRSQSAANDCSVFKQQLRRSERIRKLKN